MMRMAQMKMCKQKLEKNGFFGELFLCRKKEKNVSMLILHAF